MFIEGTSFSGTYSELTIVYKTRADKTGSSSRSYSSRQVSVAKTTKTLVTGTAIRRYSRDLASLFASEGI